MGPGTAHAASRPGRRCAVHRAAPAAVSRAFPGQLVVVPAGSLKTRANDTEYAFRAASSFTWLTGETVADAVLVMTPNPFGHDAVIYVREYAPPGDLAYFTSRLHGALWVGNVPSPSDTARVLGLITRPLDDLARDLEAWRDRDAVVLTGFDAGVDALLPGASQSRLGEVLDELRLVKDDWEIDRLQHACDATARGFADVVRELPPCSRASRAARRALARGHVLAPGPARGQRRRLHLDRRRRPARHDPALVAQRRRDRGPASCCSPTWASRPTTLYTADVTRTLPVDGTWTPDQRTDLPRGATRRSPLGSPKSRPAPTSSPRTGRRCGCSPITCTRWGILPVTAEVSCADDPEHPGAGLHRRYTLHGTSHMLGIDVHDCALARREVSTRRHARKRARAHGRARPVLPDQRPHGAGRTSGHRRADRGRHRSSPTASR